MPAFGTSRESLEILTGREDAPRCGRKPWGTSAPLATAGWGLALDYPRCRQLKQPNCLELTAACYGLTISPTSDAAVIRSITPIPITHGTAREAMSFFFVRVETEDGTVGYGEACDSFGC